jgi:16S rRNA (cytidine1402-2'-O)-methyltransferase
VSKAARLYLIPVPITEEGGFEYIPHYNLEIIKNLTHFIAEDAKTARRNLKGFGYPEIQRAEITLLNEHTKGTDINSLLQPLLQGKDMGLMSDAGCPGIADPGQDVVKLAHQKEIEIVPLVGPSSIVMSIMASGFNGQNFAFNGYLPIDKSQKIKRLRELEQLARKQQQAQFFIETPYRNEQFFDILLEALSGETLLFLGKDITSPSQVLLSKRVSEWRTSMRPFLHRHPVVFGIYV